ncbi:Aste57867_1437 [Aphanomyces stellatus]|uniref:Aste57867_1437 protein n=1 Tax=Aphanomyces stellatus TaxID=120398 RepID=A0A485K9E0_9STRA|nr:hypothetical protein As57867_001436 [Aphanomyces stellatus]VFT78654.1 Aste57867_1437 [Aphanomyces stellatus]
MLELKRGILCVHGKYMVRLPLAREREVIITKGEVSIYRRTMGTLKTKINLWDPQVHIAFVANESTLTIMALHDEIILDCKTSLERDGWLGAIYTAQSDPPPPPPSTLAAKLVRHASNSSSNGGGGENESSDTDSDFDGFTDETETLAAFQNVRSSIIMDVGQLSRDEINLVLLPTTQTLDALASPSKQAVAIASYIERHDGGGRNILLHWDILISLQISGLKLPALLSLLADRQGTSTTVVHRKPSLTHKANVSSFVRDLLFHPLYSARLRGVDEAACAAVIDRHFAHCRLRRYSHTDDDILPTALKQAASVAPMPSLVRKHSQPHSSITSSSSPPDTWDARQKRNSYPSITLSGISLARLSAPSTATGNSFATLLPLRSVLATYKLSPLAFAQQCALFHHGQLTSFPLWSFLAPSHHQKDISESFNRLTAYLVWSILAEESPTDRADVIEAITCIATASSGKTLNNFHFVMACIGGLGDTPLMPSRLPLTWKKVKAKTKAQLYELRSLCDYTGGFDTLRRKQSLVSSTAPTLPFLGIIGASLERLKSTPYVVGDGALNFERLERQYNALHVVENAMTTAYGGIAPHVEVQTLLATLPQQLPFCTPKLLHLRSLHLQAYESASMKSPSLFADPTAASATTTSTGATTTTAAARRPSMTNESARLLSFKASCALWHCVASPSARLQILVEAALADDRAAVSRVAATLHRDVKNTLYASSCAALCLLVRQGLDTIFRSILDIYGNECVELVGDDQLNVWTPWLYECVVDSVYGPMAASVQAKLQAECRDADRQLMRRFQNRTAADTLVHYTMFNPLNQMAMLGQTPIAMLRLLSSVAQELNSTDAIARKQLRTLLANSTAATPQSAIEYVSSTLDLTKCSLSLVRGIELLKQCVQDEDRELKMQ